MIDIIGITLIIIGLGLIFLIINHIIELRKYNQTLSKYNEINSKLLIEEDNQLKSEEIQKKIMEELNTTLILKINDLRLDLEKVIIKEVDCTFKEYIEEIKKDEKENNTIKHLSNRNIK